MSFIFYWERMDLGTPSTSTSTNPKGNVPTYIGVARVPFALKASPATANDSVVFSPDTNFTVTSTDIYSS